MTTIFSIIAHKLSENDKKMFYFDKLGGKEFQLKTVDISFLVYGEKLNIDQCDINIYSFCDLEKLLQLNKYFILNIADELDTKKVFKLFKTYNNMYIRISNGRLAVNNCSIKTIKGFFYLLNKLIHSPKYLLDIIYRKTTSNLSTFSFISGESEDGIKIPSFEYDNYIDVTINNKSNFHESYHLFLDLNIAYHRDIKLSYRKSLSNVDKYYLDLCNFFDILEHSTGKKVKIALHPRTKHSKYNFGNREVYLNQTPQLVADADIVLGHYSTSNNYPIIFNKKLLLLINDQMKVCDRYTYVEAFSKELDIPMINIEKLTELPNLELFFNKSKYAEYIHKYIKSNSLTNEKKHSYKYINDTIDNIIKGNN